MAKSLQKLKARQLRKKGESIKKIAQKIDVSKSTVSIWCRDIELTSSQITELHRNMVRGSYSGRMKGARKQKELKEQKIRYYLNEGIKDIDRLNNRELFLTGLGLYWGEGNKKTGGVRFINSDPAIIRFMMEWFQRILKVSPERFCIYININRIHQKREREIKKFWINLTGISKKQFRKVIFIKSKSKKIYENYKDYFGTLDLRILKSTYLLYQIRGWLNALYMWQGSSVGRAQHS